MTEKTLQQCVEKLNTVLQNADEYKNIILGGDPLKVWTGVDVFVIQQQCHYLSVAYTIALQQCSYNGQHFWQTCCNNNMAVSVNKLGFNYI